METDFFYKIAGTVLAPFRYAKKEIKEAKENLKEDAQHALANILKMTVVVFCGLLFLFFLSITIGSAINESMDSRWAGFAIVGGFYLLAAIGVYVWKNVSDKKHAQEHHGAKTVTT
jgi:hypothetical protein